MAKYNNVQEALDDWITLFSNERCQYENFCEVWEGNKRVLVSNFYSVVEATKLQTVNVQMRVAYYYIMNHSAKPKATMNATLVSHYQEELLSNNIHLDIGSGKTEPLVSTIKEYEATRLVQNKPKRISKGADDLIGKRFTSHSNPIIIQDSTHYDFDVRICYEDKSVTDWDVGMKSIRDWIEKGTLVPVPDKPKGATVAINKVGLNDYFILAQHVTAANGITEGKQYQCIGLEVMVDGDHKITFKGDDGVNWHFSSMFTKIQDNYIGKIFTSKSGKTTRKIVSFNTQTACYQLDLIAGNPLNNTVHRSKKQLTRDFYEEGVPLIEEKTEPTNKLTNLKEETIMPNPKTQISLTVSTEAFATTKAFDTIFGRPVKEMDEGDLFNALRTIERDYKVLKDLDVKDSKRVKAQMTKLKKARGKVIAALDALPEDEDES